MKRETLLKLVAWERAYLRDYDVNSTAALFQDLIDSGEIAEMGFWYVDMADMLITMGICRRPKLRIVK